MKTIIIIALFGLQITTFFGKTDGDKSSMINSGDTFCAECPFLSPVVPMEASYEDQKEVVNLMDQETLTPEIPMEADFTEEENQTVNHRVFTPVVPEEADFEELQ
ncbi:MAG: hypothetical protein HQ542_13875 [Bacteroidia bacterium]|nr:hypothetical protein [Bacteroidia bacterium]